MVNAQATYGWQRLSRDSQFDCALLQRAGHTATAVGSDIYVIGGKSGQGSNTLFNDVIKFDTVTQKWRDGYARAPFAPMCYHTATLVGAEIWVIGGNDGQKVTYRDVHVLNTKTLQWRTVSIKGNSRLLQRSVHACVLHPTQARSLLIYAGYGRAPDGSDLLWQDDLVVLKLDTLEVKQLNPKGPIPIPRGYHSLYSVGHKCYAVAGRTVKDRLLSNQDMLAVYDARRNEWLPTPPLSGSPMSNRSSHAGCVVAGDKIVIFGGAGIGKQRFSDTHVLHVGSKQLTWQNILGPPFPSGRAGHDLALCSGHIYLIAGYTSSSSETKHPADVWRLHEQALTAKPTAARPLQPSALPRAAAPGQAPADRGTNWRSAKRNRAANTAAAEPAQKRHRQLAPAGAATTADHSPVAHPTTAVPQLHTASVSVQPKCLAPTGPNSDPNADPRPDPGLAPEPQCFKGHMGSHGPRVCGGCAFSDVAATSAMMHKLQAELAQANTALQDKTAALQQSAAALQAKATSEDALQRQKQDLEASMAALRGQVAASEQQCSARTGQCAQLQRDLQAAEVATAETAAKLSQATDTASALQRQLTTMMQQRDHYSQLASDRHETIKQETAQAEAARNRLRQERVNWETADKQTRTALSSIKQEYAQLQGTTTSLHANLARLNTSLEAAQAKAAKGAAALTEARRQAGEERQQSAQALGAQQATSQDLQHRLQSSQAQHEAAEANVKKIQESLTQVEAHAASLQQQLAQTNAKLAAAEADKAKLRSDAQANQNLMAESNKDLERRGQQAVASLSELMQAIGKQSSAAIHQPRS